jgi:hypothetical protein
MIDKLQKYSWISLGVALLIALISFPRSWYPMSIQAQLYSWFGPPAYTELNAVEMPIIDLDINQACPEDFSGWRARNNIEGIEIMEAKTCTADNPYAVAAFVRGTNNVSMNTLMQSGLTRDAVTKEEDLDDDGDPDVIHIRLEVVELNGYSPDSQEESLGYEIAPGINPGFWVFAPKLTGMASISFESNIARDMLRLPSPPIRIEQGDQVFLTLENSHTMPHTIHLHGIDHPYVNSDGEGNDGVPIISELPVMPGQSKTYEINPRVTGFGLYHCHVQPQIHIMMGLQGLFIVEPNKPNNYLQTLNVGAGQVRAPSQDILSSFDQEYDLHYLDLDSDLNNTIQEFNDPRLIAQKMNQSFNMTEAIPNYFTLNGLSFPYTFRDSLIVVSENEEIKLRIANGGINPVAFHIHGHRPLLTHLDGVQLSATSAYARDVFSIDTAQRIDLTLNTSNDGNHSNGSGVWLYHDHKNQAVTNNGIGPGGHISALVYDEYMTSEGWPMLFGMNWGQFFSADYYERKINLWAEYAPNLASTPNKNIFLAFRLFVLGSALTIAIIIMISKIQSFIYAHIKKN